MTNSYQSSANGHSPVHQQIFLHPEALCAAVAVEAVMRPAGLRLVISTAVSFRQLSQLVLSGAERPGLFPDSRGVDHQTVL